MRATIQSREELLEAFGPEFLTFFIGLAEAASERARGFFRSGEKYNRTVGATIMRYMVREGLKEASETMFGADANGFSITSARNLAVWFEFEGLSIRAYTVQDGKYPVEGDDSPVHRNEHFSNVPPQQPTLFGKPWLGNVTLLWSFDCDGSFIGLRAVIGDGWDEEGQLKLLVDLELPTTAVELRAQMGDANFNVEEDDEKLVTVAEVESSESNKAL